MSKKLTIEEMRKIAQKRGGKCLSDIYVDNKTKLLWECSQKHKWEAMPNHIKAGKWCPYCAGKAKGTIEEMRILAEKRGGRCLSDTYVNSTTKLLWECAQGHQWEARPASLKRQGQWCPYCAGNVKGSLEEMVELAEERGARCLSDTYVNSQTKLLWECAEGHQWEATPGNIKSGSHWCPYCAGQGKGTIEEMWRIAAERGGRCLSNSYTNNSTKLLWECAEGHRWEAPAHTIKDGHWCIVCAGKAQATIEEMQKIADERGGKCLSESYVNSQSKLLWECAEGHQWEARSSDVKRGVWCPECSSGLGERICRAFFEQLFGRRFPRSYPRWLVNQKKNQMELDGYCKPLKLAFEHHGKQHYSTDSFFIPTEEALRERQEADRMKKTLCTLQGVTLIEIPEIPTQLSIKNVKNFIKEACQHSNILLPLDFDTIVFDLKSAYTTPKAKEAFSELQRIAEEHGGQCLSDVYVNGTTKLLWQCKEGHRWKAAPAHIRRGHWCPKCGGTARLSIEEMKRMAEERGGRCLSNVYTNAQTKLLWECGIGHRWEAVPSNIRRGCWCPQCAKTAKGTLEEMYEIAKLHGGKCLSDTYVNNRTKLLWECAQGHRWEAQPKQIKRGQWCPQCAGNVKKTIEDMQVLANTHQGNCLSTVYINAHSKLQWECIQGHRWKATPHNIQQGQWCPYCKGKSKERKPKEL